MMDCIFCKIINKEESTEVVFEDGDIVVIKDIHPKSPTHLLIIPKKHIVSANELKEGDKDLVWNMFAAAKKIAEQKSLKGYQLKINVGREGGQIIDHLHMHLESK